MRVGVGVVEDGEWQRETDSGGETDMQREVFCERL